MILIFVCMLQNPLKHGACFIYQQVSHRNVLLSAHRVCSGMCPGFQNKERLLDIKLLVLITYTLRFFPVNSEFLYVYELIFSLNV